MGQQGALLRQRYRLQDVIGKGALSGVWRARDELLDRAVAVKILRPRYAEKREVVERFREEAGRAASLSHPNIVPIFDSGLDESTGYIVMQLVEGPDMAAVLRRHGRLPPDHALRIVSAATDALQVAHDRGWPHRNIKPGNILLDADGEVRLVDFAIAATLGDKPPRGPGSGPAAVRYWSPEQVAGEPVGPRSDVYSLGLVLHELLTGQMPFPGRSTRAVARARLEDAPPPPSSLVPDLPKGIDRLVMRALAREPRRRYTNARRFGEAIEKWWSSSRPAVAAPAIEAPAMAAATPALAPVVPAILAARAAASGAAASVKPPPWVPRGDAATAVPPWLPERLPRPRREDLRTRMFAALMPLTALMVVAAAGWSFGWSFGGAEPGALDGAVLEVTGTPPPGVIAFPPSRVPDMSFVVPTATPSPAPTPSPEPTPEATPETTERPAAAPPAPKRTQRPVHEAPAAPTEKPAPTTAPTPTPTQAVRGPADTVAVWYGLIAEHRFDEAAQLWSPRMQEQYPPEQWINRRYAWTTGIDLHRVELVGIDEAAGRALVEVELTEHRRLGPPRYRSGAWELVRTELGWLLDVPHFQGR